VNADDIKRLAENLKEVYAFKYGGFDVWFGTRKTNV
jgi:hypothetical protein